MIISNSIVLQDLHFFNENFPFIDRVQNKTFLVTGATGFIGSMLVACLLELQKESKCNINIIAFARSKSKAESLFPNANIQWFFQDLSQPINKEIPTVDYIIHCATPTISKFYIEQPVETIHAIYHGTNSLLEYAYKNDIKGMVYLSSIESYGTCTDNRIIDESYDGSINPINTRSSYSLGKKMTECLCHSFAEEYGIPVKIARLTQTFGAGVSLEDHRVFAQFAKQVMQKENIILHTKGESAKPYCYITDAISAIFYLLFKGKNGEAYNIANDDTYISIYDMAIMLINRYCPSCKIIIEENNNMGYAPITHLHLTSKKLALLGWKPFYNLENMFDRLIAYYQEEIKK